MIQVRVRGENLASVPQAHFFINPLVLPLRQPGQVICKARLLVMYSDACQNSSVTHAYPPPSIYPRFSSPHSELARVLQVASPKTLPLVSCWNQNIPAQDTRRSGESVAEVFLFC